MFAVPDNNPTWDVSTKLEPVIGDAKVRKKRKYLQYHWYLVTFNVVFGFGEFGVLHYF